MKTSWVMTQTWEHLLFMHWKVRPEALKPWLPSGLELDLFEGRAWLTILPFQVTHQRIRGIPEIPLLNSFSQLNVRTYVKHNRRPGIYFFPLTPTIPFPFSEQKQRPCPLNMQK